MVVSCRGWYSSEQDLTMLVSPFLLLISNDLVFCNNSQFYESPSFISP